jgi:hypothetical protein
MSKNKLTREQIDSTANFIYQTERRQGNNVSYEKVRKETRRRLVQNDQRSKK